jgi:23S rRNA (guanine1835-N2)-methyltransferase
MQTLKAPQATLELERFPRPQNETLRAWDAADVYLLEHLAEQDATGPMAILNEGFGALSLTLLEHHPTVITDSELTRLAIALNGDLNDCPFHNLDIRSCDESWPEMLALVLIKIPKTSALLEYQLHRLRSSVTSSTRIIAAGMTRHIHTSTLKVFEKFIGPTRTSLARKKARLIFAEFDPSLKPNPPNERMTYSLSTPDLTMVAYPNVFSRGKLDRGTRMLLAHLPSVARGARVVDLGCGDGVIGLAMAKNQPQCILDFIDESHMAVASARENWSGNHMNPEHAHFIASDGLYDAEPSSVDLVLCNPPFHQGQAMGDHLAWRMFMQAKRVLRPGGELRIVGNRHLHYHEKLNRLFSNCTLVASDPKFVVLSARR